MYCKIENEIITTCYARPFGDATTYIDGAEPGMKFADGVLSASESQLSIDAKVTRGAVIESDIELGDTGCIYQIDTEARNSIAMSMRKAERNGYPDTEARPWRLANNEWRTTTLAELKQLLESYDDRYETVWYLFGEWDAGDKSEPFDPTL